MMTKIFAEIVLIDYIFFIVFIIFGLILYNYLIRLRIPLNKAAKVKKSMFKSVITFAIMLIFAIIINEVTNDNFILSIVRFLVFFLVQYVVVAIYVHRLKQNV